MKDFDELVFEYDLAVERARKKLPDPNTYTGNPFITIMLPPSETTFTKENEDDSLYQANKVGCPFQIEFKLMPIIEERKWKWVHVNKNR